MKQQEQWEIDLRKQLGGVPSKEVQSTPIPEKLDRTMIYLFLILVFLVVGVYAFANKEVVWQYLNPPCENKPISQELEVRSQIERLRIEQDKINKRLAWSNERLVLLATVQQENFAALKNGDNNFIYFKGDWTINQMPRFLELTPEDKEFLKKYLKN